MTTATQTIALRSEPITLKAASGKTPTFEAVAYTGAPIRQGWSADPIVIDLAGITAAGAVPIFRDHDPNRVVGHTTKINTDAGSVLAAGVLSGSSAHTDEIVEAAKKGFPWQMSVGGNPTKTRRIAEGKTETVNGRDIEGPALIVEAMELNEISFVPLGADRKTSANIAAKNQRGAVMDDQNQTNTATAPTDPEARAGEIRAICSALGDDGRRVAAKAIVDGTPVEEVREQVRGMLALQERRQHWETPDVVATIGTRSNASSRDVLTAALVRKAGDDAAKIVGEGPARIAAQRLGDATLLQILAESIRMEGGTPPSSTGELIRAAFSTVSLPQTFSDAANKMAAQGFRDMSNAWRLVSRSGTVSDFKAIHNIRVDSSKMDFEEIPEGGEFKHATLLEEPTSQKARTFGNILSLTRQAIINDDLGVLSNGRRWFDMAAARRIADEWVSHLADPGDHFSTANGNLLEGNVTAFGPDSLATAMQAFRRKRDADGRLIDLRPRTLLVPAALEVPAIQLIRGESLLSVGSTDRTEGVANPFRDLQIVVEPRLDDISETAWYLVAGTADEAFRAYFLNGRDTPIYEVDPAPFNMLGLQMRGYIDFSIGFGEPRAILKMTGEEPEND